VMELLQGETLAERLTREGPLPIAQAVEYVQQAALPLGEMHEQGIVHRDVKPSNIFLARGKNGAKDKVKLIDFGVAAFRSQTFDAVAQRAKLPSRAESSLTLAEAVIGTPRYMAPEQIQASKEVDGRADVWALGVTLYVLLTGTPPFDAATALALMSQIQQVEPPPLASKRPEVPAALAQVVHQCLAKDPAARPHDARALATLLAPFVLTVDLGVSTPGVALLPAPHRPARRVGAIVTAALGVVAGVTVAAVLASSRGSEAEATRVAAPRPETTLTQAAALPVAAALPMATTTAEPTAPPASTAPQSATTTPAAPRSSATVADPRPRPTSPTRPRAADPSPRPAVTTAPPARTAKTRRLPDDDRIE